MLILDALSSRIHTVKLRGKNAQCKACGESPEIDHSTLPSFGYESFASSPMSDAAPPRQELVGEHQSITCREYNQLVRARKAHVLLDVRDQHQYVIASLPDSLNVPFDKLLERLDAVRTAAERHEGGKCVPVYVICRRGNDSQLAVEVLRHAGFNSVYDIAGGLQSWVEEVDATFPVL